MQFPATYGIFERGAMNSKQQIIQDAKALQDQLRRLQVGASIDPKRCLPGGNQLAFFGLQLHGKTSATDVAKVLPELTRAISQSRRQRTHVRFDELLLRLETEHPNQQPLPWLPSAMRRTRPHSATLGVSHHDGEQVVGFSFEEVPQVLVAGETGSGKTVLVRNLLTSLAYATSPDALKIVLVDPKNEDLRPYATLPHVVDFAGTQQQVAAAIERVAAEVQTRINRPDYKPYRLLLIVDELAQLTQLGGAVKTLGSIMSIGRSKLVNCVVCTQQPTEEGGMGSMMKANVPLRLIGAVSAGQSYTATRRKHAGADLLPGNGAFLFIKGLELFRFQSYFMDNRDERHAIAMIAQKWGSTASSTIPADRVFTRVMGSVEPPVEALVEGIVEPPVVEPQRDEIADIAEQIRGLVVSNASKNAMCKAVFGRPYAGSYAAKIDAAIARAKAANGGDNKIIRLPRTGTSGD